MKQIRDVVNIINNNIGIPCSLLDPLTSHIYPRNTRKSYLFNNYFSFFFNSFNSIFSKMLKIETTTQTINYSFFSVFFVKNIDGAFNSLYFIELYDNVILVFFWFIFLSNLAIFIYYILTSYKYNFSLYNYIYILYLFFFDILIFKGFFGLWNFFIQEIRNIFKQDYTPLTFFYIKIFFSFVYYYYLLVRSSEIFYKIVTKFLKNVIIFSKHIFVFFYRSCTEKGYLHYINVRLSRRALVYYYIHLRYKIFTIYAYCYTGLYYWKDLFKIWWSVISWHLIPHIFGTFLYLKFYNSLKTNFDSKILRFFKSLKFFLQSVTQFVLSASWIRLQDASIPEFVEISYPLTTWAHWTYSTIKLMYKNDGHFLWTLQKEVDKRIFSYINESCELPLYLSKSNPDAGIPTISFLNEICSQLKLKSNTLSELELSHQVDFFFLEVYDIYKQRLTLVLLEELKKDPYVIIRLNLELSDIKENPLATELQEHYLFDFLPILDKLFHFWQLQVIQDDGISLADTLTTIKETIPNSAFTRDILGTREGTKSSLSRALEALGSTEWFTIVSEILLEPFVIFFYFFITEAVGRHPYSHLKDIANLSTEKFLDTPVWWINHMLLLAICASVLFPLYCHLVLIPIYNEMESMYKDWYFRFRLACVELINIDPEEHDDMAYIILFVFALPYLIYRFPKWQRDEFPYADYDPTKSAYSIFDYKFQIPWKELKKYDKILFETEKIARTTYLNDVYAKLNLRDNESIVKEKFTLYMLNYVRNKTFFVRLKSFIFNENILLETLQDNFFRYYKSYLLRAVRSRKGRLPDYNTQYVRNFLEHPSPTLILYDFNLNKDFYNHAEHLRVVMGINKNNRRKNKWKKRLFKRKRAALRIGKTYLYEDLYFLQKILRWQATDKRVALATMLYEPKLDGLEDEEDGIDDAAFPDFYEYNYMTEEGEDSEDYRLPHYFIKTVDEPINLSEAFCDVDILDTIRAREDKFLKRFFYRLAKIKQLPREGNERGLRSVTLKYKARHEKASRPPFSLKWLKEIAYKPNRVYANFRLNTVELLPVTDGFFRTIAEHTPKIYPHPKKKRRKYNIRRTGVDGIARKRYGAYKRLPKIRKTRALRRLHAYSDRKLYSRPTKRMDLHGKILCLGFDNSLVGHNLKLHQHLYRRDRKRDLYFLDIPRNIVRGPSKYLKHTTSAVVNARIFGNEWHLLLKAAEEHFVFNIRKTQLVKLQNIFSKVHDARTIPRIITPISDLNTQLKPVLAQLFKSQSTAKVTDVENNLNSSYIDLYEIDPLILADLVASGSLDPLKLNANLLDELIANEYLKENVHKQQGFYIRDWLLHAGELRYDMKDLTSLLAEISPTLSEKVVQKWEALENRAYTDLIYNDLPIEDKRIVPYVSIKPNSMLEKTYNNFIKLFNVVYTKINQKRDNNSQISRKDLSTLVLFSKDILSKPKVNLQVDELSYIYLLKNAHNLIKEHLIYHEADTIEEYQALLYEDEFEEVDSNEIDEFPKIDETIENIIADFIYAEQKLYKMQSVNILRSKETTLSHFQDHYQQWSLSTAIENMSGFNLTFPELEEIFSSSEFIAFPSDIRLQVLDEYIIANQHLVNRLFVFEQHLKDIHYKFLFNKFYKKLPNLKVIFNSLSKLDIPMFNRELKRLDLKNTRSISNTGLVSYYTRSKEDLVIDERLNTSQYFLNLVSLYNNYKPGLFEYSLEVKELFLRKNNLKIVPIDQNLILSNYWENFSKLYNISKEEFLILYKNKKKSTNLGSNFLDHLKQPKFPIIETPQKQNDYLILIEFLRQFKEMDSINTLKMKEVKTSIAVPKLKRFEKEILKFDSWDTDNLFIASELLTPTWDKIDTNFLTNAWQVSLHNVNRINDLLENEEELLMKSDLQLQQFFKRYKINTTLSDIVLYKKQLLELRNQLYSKKHNYLEYNNIPLLRVTAQRDELLNPTFGDINLETINIFPKNLQENPFQRLMRNIDNLVLEQSKLYDQNFNLNFELKDILELKNFLKPKEINLKTFENDNNSVEQFMEKRGNARPILKDSFANYQDISNLVNNQVTGSRKIRNTSPFFDFSRYFNKLDSEFMHEFVDEIFVENPEAKPIDFLFPQIQETMIFTDDFDLTSDQLFMEENDEDDEDDEQTDIDNSLFENLYVTEQEFNEKYKNEHHLYLDIIKDNSNFSMTTPFGDFILSSYWYEEFNDWVTVKQLRHEEDAAMFMVQDETLTLLYEAFDTLKKKKDFQHKLFTLKTQSDQLLKLFFEVIKEKKKKKMRKIMQKPENIEIFELRPELIIDELETDYFKQLEKSYNKRLKIKRKYLRFKSYFLVNEKMVNIDPRTYSNTNYLKTDLFSLISGKVSISSRTLVKYPEKVAHFDLQNEFNVWPEFIQAAHNLKERRDLEEDIFQTFNFVDDDINAINTVFGKIKPKRDYKTGKITAEIDQSAFLFAEKNELSFSKMLMQPKAFINTLLNRKVTNEYLSGNLIFKFFKYKKPILLEALTKTLLDESNKQYYLPEFVYVNKLNEIISFNEKNLTYVLLSLTSNSILDETLEKTLAGSEISNSKDISITKDVHDIETVLTDAYFPNILKKINDKEKFKLNYNFGHNVSKKFRTFLYGSNYTEYNFTMEKNSARGLEVKVMQPLIRNNFFSVQAELRKKHFLLQTEYWRRPLQRLRQKPFTFHTPQIADARSFKGTPIEYNETTMYPDVANKTSYSKGKNSTSTKTPQQRIDAEGLLFALQQKNKNFQFSLEMLQSAAWQEQFFNDFIEVDHISFSDTYLDFEVVDLFIPKARPYYINFSNFLSLLKSKSKSSNIYYDHFTLEKSLKKLAKDRQLYPVKYIDTLEYFEHLSDNLAWDNLLGSFIQRSFRYENEDSIYQKSNVPSLDGLLNNNVQQEGKKVVWTENKTKLKINAFLKKLGNPSTDPRLFKQFQIYTLLLQNKPNVITKFFKKVNLKDQLKNDPYFNLTQKLTLNNEVLDNFIFKPIKDVSVSKLSGKVSINQLSQKDLSLSRLKPRNNGYLYDYASDETNIKVLDNVDNQKEKLEQKVKFLTKNVNMLLAQTQRLKSKTFGKNKKKQQQVFQNDEQGTFVANSLLVKKLKPQLMTNQYTSTFVVKHEKTDFNINSVIDTNLNINLIKTNFNDSVFNEKDFIEFIKTFSVEDFKEMEDILKFPLTDISLDIANKQCDNYKNVFGLFLKTVYLINSDLYLQQNSNNYFSVPKEFQYVTNDYLNLSTYLLPNVIHYSCDQYPAAYAHNLYSIFFITDFSFFNFDQELFFLPKISRKTFVNFFKDLDGMLFDIKLFKQKDIEYDDFAHDKWDISRFSVGDLNFFDLREIHGKKVINNYIKEQKRINKKIHKINVYEDSIEGDDDTYVDDLFDLKDFRRLEAGKEYYQEDLVTSAKFKLNALDNDLTRLLHNITFGKTATEIFENYEDLFAYYQECTDNYLLTSKLRQTKYLFKALHQSLILEKQDNLDHANFFLQFTKKIDGIRELIRYVDYYNMHLPEYPILALDDLYKEVCILVRAILLRIQSHDESQKEVNLLYEFLDKVVSYYNNRVQATEAEFIKNHNYIVSTFNLEDVQNKGIIEKLVHYDFLNLFNLNICAGNTGQPIKFAMKWPVSRANKTRDDKLDVMRTYQSSTRKYIFGEPLLLTNRSHYADLANKGGTLKESFTNYPAGFDLKEVSTYTPVLKDENARKLLLTYFEKFMDRKINNTQHNTGKVSELRHIKKKLFYYFTDIQEKDQKRFYTPSLIHTMSDPFKFLQPQNSQRLLEVTDNYNKSAKKDDIFSRNDIYSFGSSNLLEYNQKLNIKLQQSKNTFLLPSEYTNMVNDHYFSQNDKQADVLYASRWYTAPSSINLTYKTQNFYKTLLQKFERHVLTEKKISLDFSFDFKVQPLPIKNEINIFDKPLFQYAFSEFIPISINDNFRAFKPRSPSIQYGISSFEEFLIPLDDIFRKKARQQVGTKFKFGSQTLKTMKYFKYTAWPKHPLSSRVRNVNGKIHVDLYKGYWDAMKHCRLYIKQSPEYRTYMLQYKRKQQKLFSETYKLLNTHYFSPHKFVNEDQKIDMVNILDFEDYSNILTHYNTTYYSYLFRRRIRRKFKKRHLFRSHALLPSLVVRGSGPKTLFPKRRITTFKGRAVKKIKYGVQPWHSQQSITPKGRKFTKNLLRYEVGYSNFPFINRVQDKFIFELSFEADDFFGETEHEDDGELIDVGYEDYENLADEQMLSGATQYLEDTYYVTEKRTKLKGSPFYNIKTIHDNVLLSGIYTAQQMSLTDYSMITNGTAIFTPYDLFGIYLDSTYGHSPDTWISIVQPETYAVLDINPYNNFIFSDGIYLRRFYGYTTDKSLLSKINNLSIMKDIEGIVTGNIDSLSFLGVEYGLTVQFQKYFGILPTNILEAFVYGTYALNNWVSAFHQSMFIENYLMSFSNIDELLAAKNYLTTRVHQNSLADLDDHFYLHNRKFDDYFDFDLGEYDFFYWGKYLQHAPTCLTLADQLYSGEFDGLVMSDEEELVSHYVYHYGDDPDAWSHFFETQIKDPAPGPYPDYKMYFVRAKDTILEDYYTDYYTETTLADQNFSNSKERFYLNNKTSNSMVNSLNSFNKK